MADEISRIKVRFVLEGAGAAEGELIRFHAPLTIDAISKRLPLEGRIAHWKEEAYFEIQLRLGTEKPRSNVESGTIAYWPMGSAICIFYGETQPYSPVNIIGKVSSNLELFRNAKSGTKVRMERI